MLLYHFTNFLNFPDVHRKGITKGEVPISWTVPYGHRPHAANLTSDGSPSGQWAWTGGPTNKVAIRLAVEIPDSELKSFREIADKYRIQSYWLNALAPYEHRCKWYFAFGGVRTGQITKCDVLDNGEYRSRSHTEVEELVKEIEAEIAEKVEFSVVTTGSNAGARSFKLKAGHADSWLIDGPEYRAKVYGTQALYPWIT